MKKLFIAAVAALFLFGSCGKKSEGTHTHEDGTEHADHDTTSRQEEFNASDSTENHHHDSTTHKHPHKHPH